MTPACQGHRPIFDLFVSTGGHLAPIIQPPRHAADRETRISFSSANCSWSEMSENLPGGRTRVGNRFRARSRVRRDGEFRGYWENSRDGVMPGGRFAELNRGNDRPGPRLTRWLTVPQESAIGRIAMRRMAASSQKIRMNRVQPVLESLEGRQLLSGNFSHKDTRLPLHHSHGWPRHHQDRRDRQPGRDDDRQLRRVAARVRRDQCLLEDRRASPRRGWSCAAGQHPQ